MNVIRDNLIEKNEHIEMNRHKNVIIDFDVFSLHVEREPNN
jgi:hypothetical protein